MLQEVLQILINSLKNVLQNTADSEVWIYYLLWS